jgi:hypothetical protein
MSTPPHDLHYQSVQMVRRCGYWKCLVSILRFFLLLARQAIYPSRLGLVPLSVYSTRGPIHDEDVGVLGVSLESLKCGTSSRKANHAP